MQQQLEGRIEGMIVSNERSNEMAASELGRINRRVSKRMESSRTGVKGKESKESKSRKVKVSSSKGKGEAQTERGNKEIVRWHNKVTEDMVDVLDTSQRNHDNVAVQGWEQIDADDSTIRREAEGRAAEILGLINRRIEKDPKSNELSSITKGSMKVEAKRTIMKQPTYISRESMENNDKENNMIELRGSLNVRKHERAVDIQHSSRKQRKLVLAMDDRIRTQGSSHNYKSYDPLALVNVNRNENEENIERREEASRTEKDLIPKKKGRKWGACRKQKRKQVNKNKK